jgi:hypothetical protein
MHTYTITKYSFYLQTDERFSVGIFIRGDVPWEEDPEVNEDVAVCSFLKHADGPLSTFKQCPRGYRLHCSDGRLQLYDRNIANTFIFLTRPAKLSGSFVTASIALQKISSSVQRVRSFYSRYSTLC